MIRCRVDSCDQKNQVFILAATEANGIANDDAETAGVPLDVVFHDAPAQQ